MLSAALLPLPAAAHLPGSGSRPDRAPLEAAKQRSPARLEPERWRDHVGYRYGWRLYEAGFYWEAHEVWEAAWLSCRPNSRERLLLAALIQLANARLKRRMGRRGRHPRRAPRRAARRPQRR